MMIAQRHKIKLGLWLTLFALTLISMTFLGFVVLSSSQQKPASNGESSNFSLYVWAIEYGVSDIARAIDFYTGALGFEVEENNCWAPLTVLRNGAVRVLLNRFEAKLPEADASNIYLNMRVGDLTVAAEAVRQKGGTVQDSSPHPFALGQSMTICDPFGNSIHLLDIANDNKAGDSKPAVFNAKTKVSRDPSGNQLKLMELPAPMLSAANGVNGNGKLTSTPALTEAGFERFKKLEGKWVGRSTKGWEETVNFKTIAKGSVVVENSFDAHPNETMMTMFYLDGERLMLTHYCVARNQPRLEATSFEDDGRTITFTFHDATNLPSRDKGHMDKAVFRFVDDDHFSSQWTWYQDGKESWMEEIKLERKP